MAIEPDQSLFIYQGLQGIDLTSSFEVLNPIQSFQVTDPLNAVKPEEKWIGVELYPTIDRKIARVAGAFFKKLGYQIPVIGQGVTFENIEVWQKQYPHTKIVRIHAPFDYDLAETILQLVKDKSLNNLDRVHVLLLKYFLGSAQNQAAIRLVERLREETGQDVKTNIHSPALAGFEHRGQIDKIKKRVPILAENALKTPSHFLRGAKVYDPVEIIEWFVIRLGLDGSLIGVDHLNDLGIDPVEVLQHPLVRQYAKAMHLSSRGHGPINPNATRWQRFNCEVSQIDHQHPWRVALDLNPIPMHTWSLGRQITEIGETADWLMAAQRNK